MMDKDTVVDGHGHGHGISMGMGHEAVYQKRCLVLVVFFFRGA